MDASFFPLNRMARRARACVFAALVTGVCAANTQARAEPFAAAASVHVADDPPPVLRVGDYRHGASVLEDTARPGLRHGVVATMLDTLADPLGIVLVHRRFASLAAALAALEGRSIDVVPMPCADRNGQGRLWVSEPYALPQAGAVVARGHPVPRELGELAGRRVAIERGDAGGGVPKHWLAAAHVVEVGDLKTGLERVANGTVDTFVGMLDANRAAIDTLGFGMLESAPLPLAVPLCLAANSENVRTVSLIEEGLARLSPTRRNEMRWQPLPAPPRFASDVSFILTEEERRWIAAHPVIRVGVERLNRPYDFLDDQGNWRGPGAVLLKRFAAAVHVRLRPVPIGGALTLTDALHKGTVDVATSYPKTVRVPEGLVLTQPYDNIPWSFVLQGDAPGSRPRVATNAWRVQQLRPQVNLSGMKIVPRARAADALRAVLAGNADAALVNTARQYDGGSRSRAALRVGRAPERRRGRGRHRAHRLRGARAQRGARRDARALPRLSRAGGAGPARESGTPHRRAARL